MKANHSGYPDLALYIGGNWIQAGERRTEPVVNPATGETLGHLPHATAADLDQALAAASEGFEAWRSTAPRARADVLLEAAQLLRERSGRISEITTLEQGKPLAESRAELARAVGFIEWDANESLRAYGRLIPGDADERKMAVREPVGPVAAFSPWNFPSSAPARKIAGSLAAGCSCILKASEETPGTAMALVNCFHDAGLPPGVLNLVFGVPSTISEHLLDSPVIRKFSFTGSTAVGKRLAGLAAQRVIPSLMELGGHAPVIVFDDADPEQAAALAAAAKFRNAGQVCVSPTRFYIHKAIYDRFVTRFAAIAASLKVDNGMSAGVQMGPLANPRRLAAMEELVADAVHCGARVMCGGKRIDRTGYFFAPTVLTEVPATARIMNEEPFGPVVPIMQFEDFDQVVEEANRLPWGLSAYVFTSSDRTATRVAARLEAGNLSINHFVANAADVPFGGVKESGFGREGGLEGLASYQAVKHVWHKIL